MIAVLHYALLKSIRDRSLAIFTLGPALVIAASLLGATLAKGELRYPLFMAQHLSPTQNAGTATIVVTIFAVSFAGFCAFWTFRSEVATKSIGSFVMARRPLSVASALVLYATAIAGGAWIIAVVVIAALTAAVPMAIAPFAAAVALVALASAAIGALLVTISPQPAMVIWAFIGCMPLVPFLITMARQRVMLIALLVAILCTATSAFLLERRWVS
jgi:hypothetical protein